MAKQLPIPAEPDDGSGQKAGRRGAVRYLQNEAAPFAARMVLGNALRHRREAIGLSAGEAARQLGGSPSKVSRIESGTFALKQQDLLKFYALYRITDPEEQARLYELSVTASQPAWWQPWSAVAPKYLQAVVSFEDMATRVRSFEPIYLHGLLQTPEYARALIERGRGSASGHDELARFRTERHERFTAEPDRKLICVVDEATLKRPVGSAEIMRGQLQHLITLTADPRFQLHLAPLNDYNVHVELGATTIFDFAGRLPTIAFAEGYDGGLVIDDEQMVDRRVKAFDALAASSLAPHAMKRRLTDMLTTGFYKK
ncbi:helix-turn-helix domain-containing protein [Streptomyces sp. DSM 110735]|uniref:helix-turn-helix domain-containing protein n=1 Tax=Streptomyces sp. DSM 110735 TaxID=2775031 RepID=UPI0027DBD13D|nr:helix-turn-helix transcriptional regulator [Streptomyces sp. DSM 110735]